MKSDVIVIGAGAAGHMCAIEAGKRKRSVLILDHSSKAGNKIRVSGGGRCNFTNINLDYRNYLSGNPDFCRSALSRFTPHDFILMLERHGINFFEKEKGQMFCRGSSGEVVGMLHRECMGVGVRVLLNCGVKDFTKKENFTVSTNHGIFESESLVVATGGLSYPELGATDIGYRIAKKFGIKITPLRPALVPLTFSRSDLRRFGELSGISVRAEVSCRNARFDGDILFTHKGLSGPAILQISSYWNKGDVVKVNLMPETDAYELLLSKQTSRAEISNLLSEFFPKRFCKKWCGLYAESKPVCQYNIGELKEIAKKLNGWEITPEGTEGYKKAEVTFGGIDTDEISSKTMESKKIPGLFFAGEVMDVTGQLGGYNLQWAWSSGCAAGRYA